MLSTCNAVVVVVDPAFDADFRNHDVHLARRTAALLTLLQPRKTTELAVSELLDQLGKEKLERESRGLNHWDKHAPQFLSQIVWQARREKRLRYQEAEAFFRAKHREAVRFALAIVGSAAAAEIVVAETFRELLEGGATIPGFFAALVCNARDYMDAEARRLRRLAPFEEALPSSWSDDENESSCATIDPMSHRQDDQDPLDILIASEEEAARQRMVAEAMEDPRWRYIKRRDWAAPLSRNVRS